MVLRRCCPGCGRPARSVCAWCRSALAVPETEPVVIGLDRVLSLSVYDERAARLVLAAKNRGRRDVARALAVPAAALVLSELASDGHPVPFDVVSWVPASRDGARRRGYDQGRVLARAVGRAIGLPSQRLLIRRRGEAQSGGDRWARRLGPHLRAPGPVPRRVLLVDDVVTTGASLAGAANALREAGAGAVSALVLASAHQGSGRAPGSGSGLAVSLVRAD